MKSFRENDLMLTAASSLLRCSVDAWQARNNEHQQQLMGVIEAYHRSELSNELTSIVVERQINEEGTTPTGE